MKTVAKYDERLPALASQINDAQMAAHDQARRTLEHYANCGLLLQEAKELVKFGEWVPWLEANTLVSVRQSQQYMALARAWPEIQSKANPDSHLTICEALKLIATASGRAKVRSTPPDDWQHVWRGMPEFKMNNTEPVQKITFNFQSREDVKELAELLDLKFTEKTNSVWWPKKRDYLAPKNFRWVDEDEPLELCSMGGAYFPNDGEAGTEPHD